MSQSDGRGGFEILGPGESTPNDIGYSKDPDGLWIHEEQGWVYFPIIVPPPYATDNLGVYWIDENLDVWVFDSYYEVIVMPYEPPVIQDDYNCDPDWNDGIRRAFAPFWNGEDGDENQPTGRGQPDNNPPLLNGDYPDASQWQPVDPEDAAIPRNGIERAINYGVDTIERARDQLERTRDNLTNPGSWRW